MAQEIAAELNVSPMEALLVAVRRRAARCVWVDHELQAAVTRHRSESGDDAPLSAEVLQLMKESRLESGLLAKTAKAAIDAGVAESIVRHLELEGQLIGAVLERVMDDLELNPDQRVRALETAHTTLLTIEAGDTSVG